MNVVEPRPNPETVEALLDITWRVAAGEAQRTEALDRKATTVATLGAVLATLSATLGVAFVDQLATWWGDRAVRRRCRSAKELEHFPTWSVIRQTPEQVRGDTMRTIVLAISEERRANTRKSLATAHALRLVATALVLVGAEANILDAEYVSR